MGPLTRNFAPGVLPPRGRARAGRASPTVKRARGAGKRPRGRACRTETAAAGRCAAGAAVDSVAFGRANRAIGPRARYAREPQHREARAGLLIRALSAEPRLRRLLRRDRTLARRASPTSERTRSAGGARGCAREPKPRPPTAAPGCGPRGRFHHFGRTPRAGIAGGRPAEPKPRCRLAPSPAHQPGQLISPPFRPLGRSCRARVRWRGISAPTLLPRDRGDGPRRASPTSNALAAAGSAHAWDASNRNRDRRRRGRRFRRLPPR
jgi:hypothetical protein